jgi:hypothetical protein
VAQILSEALRRNRIEKLSESRTHHTAWRVIFEADVDFCATLAWRFTKSHGARIGDICPGKRVSREQVILPLFDDLSIPLNRFLQRCLRYPVRAIAIDGLDRLEMRHKARVVL